MPNNVFEHPETAGVTLTPESGTAIHTNADFDLIMLEPTYSTKKRKEVTVSLPYMDGELDFSDQYQNRSFYECTEHTYKFIRQFACNATGAATMRSVHNTVEAYCWNFKGTVTDDYGASLTDARCVSFTATPFPGDNTLTLEVKFRGVRA